MMLRVESGRCRKQSSVFRKLNFGLEEFDEAALSFRLFGKDKKFCLYDTLVLNRDQRVG